ncbi:MAG: LacI family DNA-binding transcriptional regulator [Anaerolineae bacterium]|nr:LacI family DNA-binding transcriptional regulator [Anaerolineae bacterium]
MKQRLSSGLKNTEDVTLKDIAAAVGKSVAAVSRALNDYDDISEETREQVKRVAREMGYSPNLMAQRLQKRTTDTLGFVLPVLSPRDANPFFSELLAGLASEAAEHGFDLLVSTCVPGPDEKQAYQRLVNGRVDGMIVARPRCQDKRLELLLKKQIAFIVVGNINLSRDILTITDDVAEGARLAVEHVIEQGHKQIALINSPPDLVFSIDFLAGYRRAMTKAGLPVNEDFLEQSDFTQKDGYRAAQILLSKPNIPTAIVAADDMIALGAMAAAQDQGFEIGHDLVVTGYGDALLGEYAQPPLTTVHRPTYTLGQQAARMLIARLRGETLEKEYVIVKPSLVIRQSSDLALWL